MGSAAAAAAAAATTTTTTAAASTDRPLPDAFACRSCRHRSGDVVLDLGDQPPCERFPDLDDPRDDRHPLRMWRCRACGLAQLVEDAGGGQEPLAVVEPAAVTEQTGRTLDLLADRGLLGAGRRVLEFGSPHAPSWHPRLRGRGLVPAEPGDRDGVDLVLDVYGLLHEPDQDAALHERLHRLAPGGSAVFQLHSVSVAVRTGNWGELRHGHYAYWSVPRLAAALAHRGLGVDHYRRHPLDGGTAVLVATADPRPDALTTALLREDADLDGETADGLRRLQRLADTTAVALRSSLTAERDAGRRVVGYGAASRAVPVLCHAGVDRTLVAAVGDAAPAKHGRRVPGTDVPIVAPAELVRMEPDTVLLLLPDLLPEVRRALPGIEAGGGRWTVIGEQ